MLSACGQAQRGKEEAPLGPPGLDAAFVLQVGESKPVSLCVYGRVVGENVDRRQEDFLNSAEISYVIFHFMRYVYCMF